MPEAARETDPDTGGASIDGGTAQSVLINGFPAAIVGSTLTQHPGGSIQTGSSGVLVEGFEMARVGDPTSCNHTISSGSPDVEVG